MILKAVIFPIITNVLLQEPVYKKLFDFQKLLKEKKNVPEKVRIDCCVPYSFSEFLLDACDLLRFIYDELIRLINIIDINYQSINTI